MTDPDDLKKIVLVITDDPHVRDAVRNLLQVQQIQVVSVCEIQQGIELAFMIIPDLVIFGHSGHEGGLEFLRRLRDDEKTANIPFILLSQDSVFASDSQWKRLGINAIVERSDDVFKLFFIIPELLRRAEWCSA